MMVGMMVQVVVVMDSVEAHIRVSQHSIADTLIRDRLVQCQTCARQFESSGKGSGTAPFLYALLGER